LEQNRYQSRVPPSKAWCQGMFLSQTSPGEQEISSREREWQSTKMSAHSPTEFSQAPKVACSVINFIKAGLLFKQRKHRTKLP